MTDPIAELADTLYDALYAITPYAEKDFADENEGLQNAVRALLAEAAAQQWVQKQLDQTGIRAMDFRNGASMELEPAREMVAHWVGAARGMLGDAPNYSETPVEMVVKVGESPEQFAFTLQRVGRPTPHQARQQAEGRVAELEQAMEKIRHLHKDSPMGPCPVCVDADAMSRGDDYTVPYPCPTGRLAGAQDCDPPSRREPADA